MAKKSKQKTVKVEKVLFKGPTKSFRFLNPPGHPDKWNWITLQDGDVVPKEVIPQLKEQEKRIEIEKRIKELEDDLKDDGKRNNSTNKDKKAPGRKKKSKKK